MISFLIGLVLGMMIVIIGAVTIGNSEFEDRYVE